jgi:hypothetical protein
VEQPPQRSRVTLLLCGADAPVNDYGAGDEVMSLGCHHVACDLT